MKKIERVDGIPLIIYWLLKMRVAEIIDHVLPHPHPNRQGLSYGQLAVLFLTYVIYCRLLAIPIFCLSRTARQEPWGHARR